MNTLVFNPTELLKYFVNKQQLILETLDPYKNELDETEDLIKKLERCEIIMEHRKLLNFKEILITSKEKIKIYLNLIF